LFWEAKAGDVAIPKTSVDSIIQIVVMVTMILVLMGLLPVSIKQYGDYLLKQ
jgi:hypothetical protein